MISIGNALYVSRPQTINREVIALSVIIQDKATEHVIQIFQKEIDLKDSQFDNMTCNQKECYLQNEMENFHLQSIWSILKRMNNEGERFNLKNYTGDRRWENEYFIAFAHINYGFYDYLKRFEDE